MGAYIASQLVKGMLKKRIHVDGARVLVMGLTFKENCPDLRNTKVVEIVNELKDFGVQVDCYDPWVNSKEAEYEYGISPILEAKPGTYDAVVLAVAHKQFAEIGVEQIRALGKPVHVLYDLKYIFSPQASDLRL
jgi:UDP-N-acetyl-D-galactosamine dehydrogenase